ncbi:hypothetical protein FSP39_010253 [Pinctada imbricata]|uniref:Uncharacterized protein n=1 Tax=Pinctada imbricata TaxID=66713 RepID=A0AA88XV19_PINIB|nr:hypothetical protein FSP39_010253 [Pinctada imbricata]
MLLCVSLSRGLLRLFCLFVGLYGVDVVVCIVGSWFAEVVLFVGLYGVDVVLCIVVSWFAEVVLSVGLYCVDVVVYIIVSWYADLVLFVGLYGVDVVLCIVVSWFAEVVFSVGLYVVDVVVYIVGSWFAEVVLSVCWTIRCGYCVVYRWLVAEVSRLQQELSKTKRSVYKTAVNVTSSVTGYMNWETPVGDAIDTSQDEKGVKLLSVCNLGETKNGEVPS